MKNMDKITVEFNDSDFIRVFDWIGKIALSSINKKNICDEKILEQKDDIENFIKKLLPLGIEFIQYNFDKITKKELKRISEIFAKNIKFHYNCDDSEFCFHKSEALIIDLKNKKYYII